MKKLRSFCLAMVLMISTIAGTAAENRDGLNELSADIENLLKDSAYRMDQGVVVTVFFSLNEQNEIQYVTVASSTPEVDQLLSSKLKNLKLEGDGWREGIVYELCVGHALPPTNCASE